MNVSCDKCGKRYVIADDKVVGKASVKIRCKQCQNLISVSGTSAAAAAGPAPSSAPAPRASSVGGVVPQRNPWEEESTRAMPPMDTSAQWFAMVGGKQQGPYDVNQLGEQVQGGTVTLRTYLWKSGMGDWKRAADVPEVSPLFAGAPPVSSSPSGLAPPPPPPRPASKSTPAVQRDVAIANEVPAAAVARPTAQNGSGAVVQQQAPLNDLFGDVSGLNDVGSSTGGTSPELDPVGESQQQAFQESPSGNSQQPVADPFAALSQDDGQVAPPPGEATRFFIAQAGVNKRNPPWKIALAVLGFIGGPIALIYILNTFEIVKLPTVTVTNENGEEVQESFFSSSGAAGLKDILTGDSKRKREEAEKARLERERIKLAARNPVKTPGKPEPEPEPEVVKPKVQDPNLAAFYENDDRRQVGPKNRREDTPSNTAVSTSGLSEEAVGKVVADKSKAFQLCIDNALRRTPNLSVGKVTVVLVVGPSGSVKSASIDPKKHEASDWGQCMMATGKRIVFPSSDAETDVQLPFTIGVAL